MQIGQGVGHLGEGAGAAVVQLDGGAPELIAMAFDAPEGLNSIRYRVGYGLDANGVPAHWGEQIQGPTMGERGQGAGVAVANIGGSPRPDAVFLVQEPRQDGNVFIYVVGFDLDEAGKPATWGDLHAIEGPRGSIDGAGVDVADVNHDGRLDLIVMSHGGPSNGATFVVQVGFGLDATSGVVESWGPRSATAGVGDRAEGAGIVAQDFDGDGDLEVAMMAYDAPTGQNRFRIVHHALGRDGLVGAQLGFGEVAGVGDKAHGAGLTSGDLDGDGRHELITLAYDAPEGPNRFGLRVMSAFGRDAVVLPESSYTKQRRARGEQPTGQ